MYQSKNPYMYGTGKINARRNFHACFLMHHTHWRVFGDRESVQIIIA